MRMVSLLIIAVGVVVIIVAIKDNLGVVFGEIKSIGKGLGSAPNSNNPNNPGDCINPKTGIKVPCVSQNTLSMVQANSVLV